MTMVGAAAVEDMSRIFLAFGGLWCGSRGFRGVVGRDTDAVEGVPGDAVAEEGALGMP